MCARNYGRRGVRERGVSGGPDVHAEPRRGTFGRLPAATCILAVTMAIAAAPASAQPPERAIVAQPPGAAVPHAGEPRGAPGGDEIDRFMKRVLDNRAAASWRRLGDFVLRETVTIGFEAPSGSRLSGFRRVREYEWYVRGGVAVRSPVRVDGVGIDDARRRDYEREWLRDEERRREPRDAPGEPEAGLRDEERRPPRGGADPEPLPRPHGCPSATARTACARGADPEPLPRPHGDVDRLAGRPPRGGADPEPRFVTDFFYFLEWGFEPGSYYFAGRETLAGRETVRIEFYPTGSFWEEAGERIDRGVRKTSLVTLWVDPGIHQIVKYAFENRGLDFLRFRWLLRADGLQASMEMAPAGGVWMPARMTLAGRATTALGGYEVTVTREFFDYREAETGARLAVPGAGDREGTR